MSRINDIKKLFKKPLTYLWVYLVLGLIIGFGIPIYNDKSLGTSLSDNVVMTFAYPLYLFNSIQNDEIPKGLAVGDLQTLSLLNRQVMVPRFWVGQCLPRADNLYQLQITTHNDNPTWYHCNTEDSGKWIPNYPGVQCEYIIDNDGVDSVYTCDGITTNNADLKLSKCKKQSGYFKSTTLKSFVIDAGDSIYIDTDKLIGNAKLYVRYPSYGIQIRQADGFTTATSTNCLLNSINSNDKGVIDLHTIDVKDRIEIKPDIPFNIVSGLSPAISSQAVSLSDVEGGKPIYISRPNYYNLIKKADDGFEFVDTRQEFYNDKIQCIPRTTGCNDNAKIQKIVEQSCDQYGGAIVNYAPVQGDSNKLCKYTCSNGKLLLTSDCINTNVKCSGEKPLFDTATGKCVTLSDKTLKVPVCSTCFGWLYNKFTGNKYCTPTPTAKVLGFISVPLTSQNSYCPLFLIILFGLLLIVGLLLFVWYKKKKGGSKRKK